MKNLPRVLLSLTSAVLVPILVLVILIILDRYFREGQFDWREIGRNLAQVSAYTIAYMVAIGMPMFFLLLTKNWIRWWTCSVAGFCIGFLAYAWPKWPLRGGPTHSTSYLDGDEWIDTMIAGVPTVAGWIEFVEGALLVGTFGAIGGLACWAVWRRIPSNDFADSAT